MPGHQTTPGVYLENLGAINRDLKLLGPKVQKAAKAGMLEGAEPIRHDVERRALADISGMKRKKTSNWDLQRSGETAHEVYIAPVERGDKKRRDGNPDPQKFVPIMFGKAYNPAFEQGRPGVVAFVNTWLDRLAAEFNA